MKILVTGVKGQLGYDIVRECHKRNIDVTGVDIDEMDITVKEDVKKTITSDYDAVIHCAAYTAVDNAEDDEDNCRKINRDGTQNIAEICELLDIPMMYFSTDYVFSGEGNRPWEEYDERKPINVYGQTKYEGELIVEKLKKFFIVRISWVFGENGNNFVDTMLRLSKEKKELNVVDDQIGSPTYTADLAVLCIDMIQTDKYGVYHATNEGTCSWYDFACEIFKLANIDIKVIPVSSSEFLTRAKRPKNSLLKKENISKMGFSKLSLWTDALRRYLKE